VRLYRQRRQRPSSSPSSSQQQQQQQQSGWTGPSTTTNPSNQMPSFANRLHWSPAFNPTIRPIRSDAAYVGRVPTRKDAADSSPADATYPNHQLPNLTNRLHWSPAFNPGVVRPAAMDDYVRRAPMRSDGADPRTSFALTRLDRPQEDDGPGGGGPFSMGADRAWYRPQVGRANEAVRPTRGMPVYGQMARRSMMQNTGWNWVQPTRVSEGDEVTLAKQNAQNRYLMSSDYQRLNGQQLLPQRRVMPTAWRPMQYNATSLYPNYY